MHGNDGFCVRGNFSLDIFGREGDRFIYFGNNGHGTSGNNGECGRHIGTRWHNDRIARSHFQANEGAIERCRATCGHPRLHTAQSLSPICFKLIAFAGFAIAKNFTAFQKGFHALDFGVSDAVHKNLLIYEFKSCPFSHRIDHHDGV